MRLFLPGSTRVKICGLTTEEDARMCIDGGADALGFNFYAGSRRFIDPATSLGWIESLKGTVDRIAVVVNPAPSLLELLWGSKCFEMIQFHGDETPGHCATTGVTSWMKALRVRDADTLGEAAHYATPHILLDAWSASAYGGTGAVADWRMIGDFTRNFPARHFVLAGGLKPDNVAEAIRVARPCAVDVAGGVESAPGKKDAGLVSSFLAAVNAA